MANGRFVSKSISYDERLNELSLLSHFLYVQCIPHLDRDGVLTGERGAIKAMAVPARDEIDHAIVAACVDEWKALELVTEYRSGRHGTALFFHGFHKNQVGMRYDRETPSRYDCPPGYQRTKLALVPAGDFVTLDDSGSTPDLNRTLTVQREVKLREGKGSEEKLSEEKPQPCPFGGAGGAGAGLASQAPACVAVLSPEPEGAGAGAGLTDLDPAAVALLTDTRIGIEPPQAAWAARNFAFADIRAQCFRFERERAKGKAQGPGVIIARLKNGWPAEITDADLERSVILAHHRAPGDDEIERQRRRSRYGDPGASWQ